MLAAVEALLTRRVRFDAVVRQTQAATVALVAAAAVVSLAVQEVVVVTI